MKIGPFFVGVWLVLTGLRALVDLQFQYDDSVMAGLALVAGILTLIRQ